MPQKFDCAIIVQLLCISQVDEKQILQNLYDLCIPMVNRYIPPDTAVQMRCKRSVVSVRMTCKCGESDVQMRCKNQQ